MSRPRNLERQHESGSYDLENDGENIPPEVLVRLTSLEKEVRNVISDSALSSPSRNAHGGAMNINVRRDREDHGSRAKFPLRKSVSSEARHSEIDLATELGRNLVTEVRKLQAQLFEKDELLRETMQSYEKQAATVDELELKMKTAYASEGIDITRYQLDCRLI